MTKRVTVEEMLRILDCWRNHSDFPEVFDAICATLKEHAALSFELEQGDARILSLKVERDSLKERLAALERENAELKEWKVGVVERTKGLLSSFDELHPQDWDWQMMKFLDDLAAEYIPGSVKVVDTTLTRERQSKGGNPTPGDPTTKEKP